MTHRALTILLLTLLLCSFRFPTIDCEITGHLRSKSHTINVKYVTIIAKGNDFGYSSAKTNSKGDFLLSFNTGLHDPTPIKFYYINNKKDTVFIKQQTRFDSDQVEMTFYIP